MKDEEAIDLKRGGRTAQHFLYVSHEHSSLRSLVEQETQTCGVIILAPGCGARFEGTGMLQDALPPKTSFLPPNLHRASGAEEKDLVVFMVV